MTRKRIPLGPDYHAEPGETKGHQHDVYTTKGELFGYERIHVGTLMKSADEDLATVIASGAPRIRPLEKIQLEALTELREAVVKGGGSPSRIAWIDKGIALEKAAMVAPSHSAGEDGR